MQKADAIWEEMVAKHGWNTLASNFTLYARDSEGKKSSIKEVWYSGTAGITFKLKDGRYLTCMSDGMLLLGPEKGKGAALRLIPETDEEYKDGPDYRPTGEEAEVSITSEEVAQFKAWQQLPDVVKTLEVISYLYGQPYRYLPPDVKEFIDGFKKAGEEVDEPEQALEEEKCHEAVEFMNRTKSP